MIQFVAIFGLLYYFYPHLTTELFQAIGHLIGVLLNELINGMKQLK